MPILMFYCDYCDFRFLGWVACQMARSLRNPKPHLVKAAASG